MRLINLKQAAILYRKQGYSYNIISGRLGIAKSTLSDWLKEIPFRPNKEVLQRIRGAQIKSALIKNQQKLDNIKRIRLVAKREFGKLTERDLWVLGIGLYLGEGMKSRESIRIINSDPKIIRIAIKWFRQICKLELDNIRIAIHTYPDNSIPATIDYWSGITGIPKEQFGKTQIDRRTNKSNRKKQMLPYGTAHLTIRANGRKEFGVVLHRRIMGWIEAVLNQT